jgi:hypothetical protein
MTKKKTKKTTTTQDARTQRTSYRSANTERIEGIAFTEEEIAHVRAWLERRGEQLTVLMNECEAAVVKAGFTLPNMMLVRDAALARTREKGALRRVKMMNAMAGAL